MKKKRKIIKSFFALLYVGAMSIPLVVGLYNFIKEWHDTNAVNAQTQSLLSSDAVDDIYKSTYIMQFNHITSTSNIIVQNDYLVTYNGVSSGNLYNTPRYFYNSIDVDWYQFSGTDTSVTYVAFEIDNYNFPSRVRLYYYDNSNTLSNISIFVWGTFVKQINFHLLSVDVPAGFDFSSSSINFNLYMKVYNAVSDAVDVPSNAEKFLDYDAIVQSTIDDSHMDDLNVVVDIDFVGLFGAVYDSAIWVFLNSYINYIINMALIIFMPEIILLFIQWCRDLIYTFTDKQEGGF